MKKTFILLSILALVTLSCSDDDSTNEPTNENENISNHSQGLLIMCEGNWGSNNAAVDYLDINTLSYTKNIFAIANPEVAMGLGDMGCDIQMNNNQLWIAVNGSNKIEVLSAETYKRIAKIDIPNCRYVVFDNDYAYVSSYVGPMAADGVQLGTIYKISTNNFTKLDSVVVSYQPEEMAIIGNRLYAACSGGYRYPVYDRVVSTVDLNSFKKTADIDIAPNLHRLRKDSHNQLWVTTRGNYSDISPSLAWLSMDDTGNMSVGGTIDIAVSDMCIVGDSLYYFGVEWSNETMSNEISYGIINTKTHQQVQTSIFNNEGIKQIEVPYGIIVNPEKRDFYITDAKNYISSGKLFHFAADGSLIWSTWTSDIPSRMVFKRGK